MSVIKLDLVAPDHVKAYYQSILEATEKQLAVASAARRKGLDVSLEVETKPVADLADRCETLIGPPGVGKRFRDLTKEGKKRMDAIVIILDEILDHKLGDLPSDAKRVEQAIKTALVLATDGVVIAPLDGVPEIKISENPDKSRYIDIYYAGPIRAAGGTATVLPFILGDYARKKLGLDRFKPTEDEVERYVEECRIYQEEIFSRQYRIKDEEVRAIVRGCPVCINGEPTEDREASVHRNLPRIPSNRVRGGMCLVISEGIALKARKILEYAKMLDLDWAWLANMFSDNKKKEGGFELKADKKFLEGMAVGRPVFSYPSAFGGFRLRYGRARNMGIMGKGIHPASMEILDEFIAVATQMKVERPGKAAGMFPVDSIEPPIVRLHSGDVVKIESADHAKRLKTKIEKVLFLGDLLVCLGDFKYSAHPLVPVGFVEEWWELEIEQKLGEKKSADVVVQSQHWTAFDAFDFAQKTSTPLHPRALFYYTGLSRDELLELATVLEPLIGDADKNLRIEWVPRTKHFLERMGVSHTVKENTIVLSEENAFILRKTLGLSDHRFNAADWTDGKKMCDVLSAWAGVEIRDKAGTWVGSRMGRPEAAKPRQMAGNPHVLFPIGENGGNTRSINKAMTASGANANYASGRIAVEIARYRCPGCQKLLHVPTCPDCRARTLLVPWCKICKIESDGPRCRKCAGKTQAFEERVVDLGFEVQHAADKLGVRMPDLVKGVKGMINADKVTEPIEKGLLRARHDLHVFRDATIRYEVINAPLTHFSPSEIGLTVQRARELGYAADIHGKPLDRDDQLLELFPQDIVIPNDCGDFFVRVTQFIDEELVRLYGLTPFFEYTEKQQLVGELALGLAPHTSAAIVCRIIGFSHAHACFGHPYYHMTKRRNIDGDQDSLMLLMDGLLNFSNSYLPASRGGRMDAPLVFTIALSPLEIDGEVYDMETVSKYPLCVYETAAKFGTAGSTGIERVEARLGKPTQYAGFGFTHQTSRFDGGPSQSKYVTLGSMEEKLRVQVLLQNRLACVDGRDALENVMTSHLLPDIIGNTRAFSRQTFRCTNCNEKMRRIPLNGKCTKCKQEKIVLTIAQASVSKYLEIAKKFILEFHLSDYLRQRIELAEEEIASVFQSPKKEQKNLFEYI